MIQFNKKEIVDPAKLNEKEVKEIRLRLIEKQKQRDIAKQYNVSENVISTIKHNTRYRGIVSFYKK